jgi:hypothetical protein
MDVDIKSGMNRFQWGMRGPLPAGLAGGGRSGRGGAGGAGGAAGGRGGAAAGVPFVSAGGGGFGGAPVAPGTYMIRLTVGTQTLTSSVSVLEDIWMRPQ